MSRDPEHFRFMSPSQIMATLVIDENAERQTKARSVGAACSRCLDTGMAGGAFCGCSAGGKLAYQGHRR